MTFSCGFVTFPYGVSGQVWYSIVSIPNLCRLPYFLMLDSSDFQRNNNHFQLSDEKLNTDYFSSIVRKSVFWYAHNKVAAQHLPNAELHLFC